LHAFLTYNYFYPKKNYSVDNLLCFIIGIYYSILKQILDKIFMKSDILYFGNVTIIIIIYYYFYNNSYINIYYISITNGLFSIIIILISMKIRFSNEFLINLNNHSYSIYLLQRVIMRYIHQKKLINDYEFIRFIIIFTSILFISNIFDKYTSFIDRFLKPNVNSLENIKKLSFFGIDKENSELIYNPSKNNMNNI
jgi:peptidoglycan/LPS O-acetylase OafA/YrhL